jgi:DNA-binding IclR family transcriptional regulator
LAGLPEERFYEVLRGVEFKSRTAATITSFEKLKDDINKVRDNGVSRDMGEYDEDLRGLGAAIKNYRGRTIACISLAVPSSRYNEAAFNDLAKAVKETADKISYSVGYTDK